MTRWVVAALAVLLLGRGAAEPRPGEHPDDAAASDLAGDLRRMWQTRKLRGSPGGRASTDRAINAASRVFNTVELVGRTRDEVIAELGDPRTASDTIYNFPFWPAPTGALVYRFDGGSYGWQFNVLFELDGRVRSVERHWIH